MSLKLSFGKSVEVDGDVKMLRDKIVTWIKDSVRSLLGSPPSFLELKDLDMNPSNLSVSVTEVACNDPNCVPIETMVIVVNASDFKYMNKIPCPLSEVTLEDVSELIQRSFRNEMIRYSRKRKFGSEYHKIELLVDSNIDIVEENLRSIEVDDGKVVFLEDLIDRLQSIKKDIEDQESGTNNIITEKKSTKSDSDQPTIVPMMSIAKSKVSIPSNSLLQTDSNSVPFQIATKSMTSTTTTAPKIIMTNVSRSQPPVRHEKGSRPRGCPCCDPDNLENIVDKLFLECPP